MIEKNAGHRSSLEEEGNSPNAQRHPFAQIKNPLKKTYTKF
jgi:hypothetical protein